MKTNLYHMVVEENINESQGRKMFLSILKLATTILLGS